MSFLVRRPGTMSLLVDGGHADTLHVGIPRGGAADTSSWLLGNALVGNGASADACRFMFAMEIALQGPVLESTARHTVVVYGANFVIQVRPAASPQLQTITPCHVFTVDPGDELHIQGIEVNQGMRAYLCVAGGFRIQGLSANPAPIKVNDMLVCAEDTHPLPRRWVQLDAWPDAAPAGTVRLLPGSQLNRKLSELLLATKFTVRPESNRMGLRLSSKVSWPSDGKELVSAPVVPGTLQLPAGGQPILLGVDAQTIGGYPRLGHVITADLDRLGQLRPGDSLRFTLTDLETAENLERVRQQWLRSWMERIRWSG